MLATCQYTRVAHAGDRGDVPLASKHFDYPYLPSVIVFLLDSGSRSMYRTTDTKLTPEMAREVMPFAQIFLYARLTLSYRTHARVSANPTLCIR